MHTKNIVTITILALIFSVLAASHGEAQKTAGVKIQPSIIEERVDPGKIFSSLLHITNLGDQEETFYLVARSISGILPDGTPQFSGEEEKSELELISWINLVSTSIELKAKETGEIPFSVRIPENAPPGGHFAGILVATNPPQLQETGTAVAYGAGMILALRVSGNVIEEADIREFRTDKAIYSKPDVRFITKVENIGNVLVRPRGPLELTDFFGKKVATLIVNSNASAILPRGIRQFEVSWQGQGLFFGRYQAVMSLSFGEDGKKTISEFLSFWVLPVNIILPVVGGILGLIFSIFILVKLHIKRKLRELSLATEGAFNRGRVRSVERELRHSQKGAPFSRLAFISVAMLIFIMLFLMVLFFFFA